MSKSPFPPKSVVIREVGPRDGFQNEPEEIGTDDKVRMINALFEAGFRRVEVASFVRPDVIPQLSDGPEVLNRIAAPDGVDLAVLIPNMKGLEKALPYREKFHEGVLFASASETHNLKNVNKSVSESMDENILIAERLLAEAITPTAVIATSFGCPFEGHVSPAQVFEMAEQFIGAGVKEIGFGDTTGMANPWQVEEFFSQASDRLPGVQLTAHFHNTRGQGLANVVAAMRAGCTSFESSFGELGGCPVPPGSTGNISTEDLVSMLHEMGVETGVDLLKVIDAARDMQTLLGRKLTSHSLVAGPIEWNDTSA